MASTKYQKSMYRNRARGFSTGASNPLPAGYEEEKDASKPKHSSECYCRNQYDLKKDLPEEIEAKGVELQLPSTKVEWDLDIDLDKVNLCPSIEEGDTSTNWAEILDVSQPVPELNEEIKTITKRFPFELDNFQKQAILKLESDYNVLVTAHTSAGKTVVAEYAIAKSKRNKTKAFYTAPIKALSNQKFKEFSDQFDDVGLMTGDIQVNTTASCLVMTTEILRSMVHQDSKTLRNLEFVILDEVHYFSNPERGHVWEEVIILLPKSVRLILLSATISNVLEFADWVGRIRSRKVFAVCTTKRPVPLCHYLYTAMDQKFLIVDKDEKFLEDGFYKAMQAMHQYEEDEHRPSDRDVLVALTDHLKQENILPAINFLSSRAGCDSLAEDVMDVELTTPEEKEHIKAYCKQCIDKLQPFDRELRQVQQVRRILENGVGVHHGGILPVLREIVEILFQSGHVKMLFATETFSIGVNMPARTVVFHGTQKFDGKKHRPLKATEYTQMAGRAGRRGQDETGSVIILCNRIGLKMMGDLKNMILGAPQELTSQFRLTYATILSLLQQRSGTLEKLIQSSFRESNKLFQMDHYKKKLKLAQMEYSEKCSTPLAPHLEHIPLFIDAAAAYIDVRNRIMPIHMNTKEAVQQIVPGRILMVSTGPYVNQMAMLLNKKGPKQSPYQVLLLNAKIEGNTNIKLDDKCCQMLGLTEAYETPGNIGQVQFIAGIEERILDYVILCIAPKDIVVITTIVYNTDPDIILDVWQRRQLERFKDCPIGNTTAKAVRILSCISQALYSGTRKLDEVALTQPHALSTRIPCLLEKMKKCYEELEKVKSYTAYIPNFISEFAVVFKRVLLTRQYADAQDSIAFTNTYMYREYKKRLLVLKKLDYIGDYGTVLMKGEAACQMGCHELLITELVYRKTFNGKSAADIAALFSCFVVRRKSTGKPRPIPDRVEKQVTAIRDVEKELWFTEHEYKVDRDDGRSEELNFDFIQIVHSWVKGYPLKEIVFDGDIDVGNVYTTIQQLHELLHLVKHAADIFGDTKFANKLSKACSLLSRDTGLAGNLHVKPREKQIKPAPVEQRKDIEGNVAVNYKDGPPKTKNNKDGPPKKKNNKDGPPKKKNNKGGPPKKKNNKDGLPKKKNKPSKAKGKEVKPAPVEQRKDIEGNVAINYKDGPPKTKNNKDGPPKKTKNKDGPPKKKNKPSKAKGKEVKSVPVEQRKEIEGNVAVNYKDGPPKTKNNKYGPPKTKNNKDGPPKKKKNKDGPLKKKNNEDKPP